MKLIFFGSSQFSIPILEALAKSSYGVSLVVSTPASKKGRGLKLEPSLVEAWCAKHKVPVLTPTNLKDQNFLNALKKLDPDYIVVASYGKMLPMELLKIPKKLPLNIHPSILPKYRGAAPIARQILNGEKETGVTIAKITHQLDAGEIINVSRTPLSQTDDSETIEKTLSKLSCELILKTIEQIEKGKINFTPQDESKSTYAAKIEKSDGQINWKENSDNLYNLVRGMQPWPSAFTFFSGKRIKILKAEKINEESRGVPGEIKAVGEGGIDVQTGAGILRLVTVHPEAGKSMSAYAFAQGQRLKKGDKFL